MRAFFFQAAIVLLLSVPAQTGRVRGGAAAARPEPIPPRRESALAGAAAASSGRDTGIRYVVSRRTRVSLAICDLSGRRVRHLADREAAAGSYIVAWDGKNDLGRRVEAGVYYYQLSVADGGGRNTLIVVDG